MLVFFFGEIPLYPPSRISCFLDLLCFMITKFSKISCLETMTIHQQTNSTLQDNLYTNTTVVAYTWILKLYVNIDMKRYIGFH